MNKKLTGLNIASPVSKSGKIGIIVMLNRVYALVGTSLAFAMMAGPSWAGTPVRVPEPATMTVMAVGVGAAFVARKFLRKK